MKRVGISMRASHATQYHEYRDAIDRDWYKLFKQVELDIKFILLPNIDTDIIAYSKYWGIDGLILTGGDDLGVDKIRDYSELSLLDYFKDEELPVLGICRGAQLINHYFGGSLSPVQKEVHVANNHTVSLVQDSIDYKGTQQWEVNSYHALGIRLPLPHSLDQIVMYNDECEGFKHQTLPWIGLMWHPERDTTCSIFDKHIFNFLFKEE